jgi:hypothetical protein
MKDWLCVLEIWQRRLNSEMQKGRRNRSGPRCQSEPKAYRDESAVDGRRISRRRFGERLRRFGRANIGLAQSLLV